MPMPAQWPQTQQAFPMAPQQQPVGQPIQYDVAQLPPMQGQPGAPQGGPQPGVPGTPLMQPYYPAQPGAPQAPLQPMQQQWQPQAPQQPQQWQQPQQFQQAPQAPQPLPGSVQLQDNAVLDGPGVPPELRGRTWGDARRLYQALSTDWLRRNANVPQTPAAQSLQQQNWQPPQQQFGAPQQPQGPAQGGQPQGFFQNPDQRIEAAVQRALAPVLQQTQQQAVLQAREVARTGMQDFAYLEPEIMQTIAGAPAEALQNPQTWVLAANAARGAKVAAGQYQFRPQQAAPPGRQYGPGVAVPAQQPQPYQFFTEAPTAPSINGFPGAQGARQPTQEDHFYAQKWQMPVGEWMAWKYGAPQAQGGF